jgi:hypothetical protein
MTAYWKIGDKDAVAKLQLFLKEGKEREGKGRKASAKLDNHFDADLDQE